MAVNSSPVPIEALPWTRPPFAHQRAAHAVCAKKSRFALLAEQGTGKTGIMINVLAWHCINSRIRRVLVVAPLSVIPSWCGKAYGELGKCCPVPFRAFWVKGDRGKKVSMLANLPEPRNGELQIVFINYESVIRLEPELNRVKWDAIVLDESTRIKNPTAKATKSLWRIGEAIRFRYVMTGTPMVHSPLDYYSQFRFLAPEVLGFRNFLAFRNWLVAKFDWFGNPEDWQNLDKLSELIGPFSYRVLKKDCLDLPEKLYSVRTVTMTGEQRQAYDQLREDFLVELRAVDGGVDRLQVPQLLARMTRLSQITGGFFPTDDGGLRQLKPNAKLDVLMETVEDIGGDSQVIVWCRFIAEIQAVVADLSAKYGADKVAAFHGDVSMKERERIIEQFQAGKLRFFVGQAASGGLGITLTAASVAIYFSNGYSWGDRVQSEDRCHRIGQKTNVSYIDLVAEETLDGRVLECLYAKRDLARVISRDNLPGMLTHDEVPEFMSQETRMEQVA
jgi:SNF2 family DNA or RNA helicase